VLIRVRHGCRCRGARGLGQLINGLSDVIGNRLKRTYGCGKLLRRVVFRGLYESLDGRTCKIGNTPGLTLLANLKYFVKFFFRNTKVHETITPAGN